MLPHHDPAPQSADRPTRRFGVGIDTSRSGHYAAFLRDDLQPAAAELPFTESAAGYASFRQQLEGIVQHFGPVHFVVRLDAAGPYAENRLHFLHTLGTPNATAPGSPAPFRLWLSCGDPQRNKNYRAARCGGQKSDPVEARAAARYALTEKPARDLPLALELRILRQVAGRRQAVVRQRTRLINPFHHLLALTFPELALLTKDRAAGWVLELLHRYPTAPLLAQATPADRAAIASLPDTQVEPLRAHARTAVGARAGDAAAERVREQVRQLRDVGARQKRLENLLVAADERWPDNNHRTTIPGIGQVTAAVLTAVVLDIDRFVTPNKLVASFGILPIEVSSGVTRDGPTRAARRWIMSRRGNDLVRRYLGMAALSAMRCNPAVRALSARVVAKPPSHKAVAVGQAMRKLLHRVFAIWKSSRPFQPDHYPWHAPAHVEGIDSGMSLDAASSDQSRSPQEQTAGHKPEAKPARSVVTAACTDSVTAAVSEGASGFIDFAQVKAPLPLVRVLDQLGLTGRLRGKGPQQRCAGPLHRGAARGRTFRVNLTEHVFHCFAKRCGRQGDVIDLWAAVRALSLREAALDLVRTFGLEPAPRRGTEKRHG